MKYDIEQDIDTIEIKVLILTKNTDFSNQLCTLLHDKELCSKAGHRYVVHNDYTPQGIAGVQMALLDDTYIDSNPTALLGRIKLELGSIPIIYLTNPLDSGYAHTAVKSLTADYIFKSNLNGSSLHNCIRWVLHNAQLQMELEQQNKRYESLFHNAIDPSFFLNPDCTISQVNDAFNDTFGLSDVQADGRDFESFFHDASDCQRIRELLESGLKEHVDCEIQMQRDDRKGRFLCHLKIAVLREYCFDGGHNVKKVVGFHGSLSNVSYRERLRNIRHRADRVDMTYRLARTLAHEIRNPLTNINLALEHIRDEGAVDERSRSLLELIKRSSGRIDELIDQLLASSERSELTINECDLIELIEEVLEEARDRAELVNAEMLTDFDAKGFKYPCDTQKIKLAISNLLCNAIESIEGKEGQITIGTYTEDGYLNIYVEDNGIGMNDHVKQSLFDPFFTSKDKGTGLGLTATQTIISEHDGEIEVESAEGYGSTFTISLPIHKGKAF